MKYLKRFKVYESNESIEELCQKFGVENYTINSDGTVDVQGGLSIMKTAGDTFYFSDEDFADKLPIKFGVIRGTMIIANNGLKTLEGCPSDVDGNFFCNSNELQSLVGGPIEVKGDYECSYNQLVSLDGIAIFIGGTFKCLSNRIKIIKYDQIKGISNATFTFNPVDDVLKIFGDFATFKRSLEWDYFEYPNLIKLREFSEACADEEIEVPDSIEGYEYI